MPQKFARWFLSQHLSSWQNPSLPSQDEVWLETYMSALCIGYRLRWRSDIWRTDRGVAEVRSPGIRPATGDDIRHNAPGLLLALETVDQLLRTKVRRKLLNQDKPSRLASYASPQHKAKSARLAASEFSFLLAVFETLQVGACSGAGVRRKLWNFRKRRKSLVESGLLGWRRRRGAWHCSKPDSGANRSREKMVKNVHMRQRRSGLELDLRDSIFLSKTRRWPRSISVPQALSPDKHKTKMQWETNVFDNGSCLSFSLLYLFTFLPFHRLHVWNERLIICP